MKLLNFIICDDIRSEIGNKYSLIGVYDDVIEFNVQNTSGNRWPKQLKLGLFAKFTTDSEEESKKILTLRLKKKHNGIEKRLFDFNLNKNNDLMTPKIIIAIVFETFDFDSAGNLSFIFEFNDEEGKLVASVSTDNSINISEKIINQ